MTYQARQTDLLRSHRIAAPAPRKPDATAARRSTAFLTLVLTLAVMAALAQGIMEWTLWSVIAMILALPSILWIAGGAATSIIGLRVAQHAPFLPRADWRPDGRTAILVMLCREDAGALAGRLQEVSRQLGRAGLADHADLIVLSDTFGDTAIAAEMAALAPLIAAGVIRYRRRSLNTGRKPGNIADWFEQDGHRYAQMLVLDADSRMSGARIARMIHRMESDPGMGLLQAGMGLVPATSRFGQSQRLAARLLGPSFARGLAAWSGETGNYWGHNALIRCAAFAAAVRLPPLPGAAPFGGDILSHDFVEAAVIRSKGWSVVFDPDPTGSLEDGPQTLASFHKRNRRWCQGNLQHLRLIGGRGLHPLSRLHMASGIFSFLAAPIWLALVILMGTGMVTLQGALPLVMILWLLMLPKLCGFWRLSGPAATPWRRRVALRALGAETLLSGLLAPVVMLHQTGAVLAVLAGRDCGWKTGRGAGAMLPQGLAEASAGAALVALVVLVNPAAALWLLPVAGPMIAAPVLIPWMDRITRGSHPA